MIKFIVAALWLCLATVGAVLYSFQATGAKPLAEPELPHFGGLDYIKTEIISVPVIKEGSVRGYLLARFVYTVDPLKVQKLSVPAEALIADEVYSYLYGHPQVDFTDDKSLDLDAFRNGVRDSVNARVEDKLIHEVLVEQIDFLSKDEVRDNALRRRAPAQEAAPEPADADSHH